MKHLNYICFSFIFLVTKTSSLNLSNYINICHRSDPSLNKCMKQSFEKLRPFLKTGVPELSIPAFEPLIIPEIQINQGKGSLSLQTTYRDLHLWGLSKFEVKDFQVHLERDQMKFNLFFPNLTTESLYEIKGKILMLPIVGNGVKEGNYSNVEGSIFIQGSRTLENYATYFHIDDVIINLNISHLSIYFSNLFNGDKELGDAMNTFINDNWRHVMKDIQPVLEETVAHVVKQLFNAVYSNFSLEEILPL